jgi:hypothetical protein
MREDDRHRAGFKWGTTGGGVPRDLHETNRTDTFY